MRRKILPFILGGALAVASVAPAAAARPDNVQIGGAAGLVAAVVQAIVNADIDITNTEVEVVTVDIRDSFNNLLRNADIDLVIVALNNVLNNLDVDVTVTDIEVIGGDVVITLLSGDQVILT